MPEMIYISEAQRLSNPLSHPEINGPGLTAGLGARAKVELQAVTS